MLERNFFIVILLLTPVYVFGIGIALIAGGIAADSPSETGMVRLIMEISGFVLIVLAVAAEILLIKHFSRRK